MIRGGELKLAFLLRETLINRVREFFFKLRIGLLKDKSVNAHDIHQVQSGNDEVIREDAEKRKEMK